jgi:ABC-type branched-subunit amino acid transport system substrate-binding protein
MMMKAPLQILSLAVQERDVMKKALILILAVILAGCGTARPVTHPGSPMQQADEVRAGQDVDESTRKAKAHEKESPGDVAKSTATGAAVGPAAGAITGDFDRGLAVGALLPLSGKQAALGNRVLDGLIAGLGLFDRRRAAPVELRIENYGSDPAAVNRAVAKLTDKVRVLAIIGPPEFEAARVAAKAAQSAQVPLLALSPVVVSEGPRDFVFSDQRSDEREARTMASYAVKDLGLSRLVVFYPENAYGTAMMNAFRAEVQRLGGKVRRVQSYKPDQTDFSGEIKKLAALRTPRSSTKKKGAEAVKTPLPVLDFDALYLPDAFRRVRMILPQLAFHDVRGVQLLGTSQWYVPEGIRKEMDYFEGSVLTAPFFAESSKRQVMDFTDTLFGATGREPDYREALAYDTARMLLDALRDKSVTDRRSLRDRLQRIEAFEGVTGWVSMTKTGEMQRGSFILKVEGRQIVDVTPEY